MLDRRWSAVVLMIFIAVAACAREPVKTQPTSRIVVPSPEPTVAQEASVGQETPSPPPGEGQAIPRSLPEGVARGATPTPALSAPPSGGRPDPREFRNIRELQDVFFEFDSSEIRGDAERAMASNIEWMRSNAAALILIEGHCDERGTSEYNLALGQRRAEAARNYLVARGVGADRVTLISYGKERPACSESTESCWARNRRAHFLAKPG